MCFYNSPKGDKLRRANVHDPESFTLDLYIQPLSTNGYIRRRQMSFFLCLTVFRRRRRRRQVSLILSPTPAEARRREKGRRLSAEGVQITVHLAVDQKGCYTCLKPFRTFIVAGGVGDVTVLCDLCASVSQFHTRCLQIYRVLLIRAVAVWVPCTVALLLRKNW